MVKMCTEQRDLVMYGTGKHVDRVTTSAKKIIFSLF